MRVGCFSRGRRPKWNNSRLNHLFLKGTRRRSKRQEREECKKLGAFATADEETKNIQRLARNYLEELGVENEQNPRLAKYPPFFLALLAFPFSTGRFATTL